MASLSQNGPDGAGLDLERIKAEVSSLVLDMKNVYNFYKVTIFLNNGLTPTPMTQIPDELQTEVKNAFTGFPDTNLDHLTCIHLHRRHFFDNYMARRNIIDRATRQIQNKILTRGSENSTLPTVPDIPAQGIVAVPNVTGETKEILPPHLELEKENSIDFPLKVEGFTALLANARFIRMQVKLVDSDFGNASIWYEKDDDIRDALENIEKMEKNVTVSNINELRRKILETAEMINDETEKILDTIPRNLDNSLLELVPPRIRIVTKRRM